MDDSPAALAAWLLEKYQSWTDGGYEQALGTDAVLDCLTLYWVTQTAASSVRFYYETAAALGEILGRGPVTVPTAVACFPADPARPLRSLAERSFAIRRWTDIPAGGHSAPGSSLRHSPATCATSSPRGSDHADLTPRI